MYEPSMGIVQQDRQKVKRDELWRALAGSGCALRLHHMVDQPSFAGNDFDVAPAILN